MKILFVGEGANFAGVERYALTLIREISSQPGLSVLCSLFYPGPLADALDAENTEVVQLCGKRNIKSSLQMVRLLRDKKIEIVHFLDLKSVLVGGPSCLFNRRVKKIATLHGLAEAPRFTTGILKYSFALTLYHLYLRFSLDKVICVSEDLAVHFRKKLGRKKIRVVHNGTDLVSSASGSRTMYTPNRTHAVVGAVGRLDRVKGFGILLKAAQKVIGTGENVVFQIVGNGPLEDELRLQTKVLGIEDKVFFMGFRQDVLSIVEKFDLFVLPSLHEGIPYALLEAMSLSKPVICSQVGGLKEIITDGVSGIFVPPSQPDTLAEAILHLLSRPEYRTKLGAQARRCVETEFAARIMAARTKDLYDHVMNRASGIQNSEKRGI